MIFYKKERMNHPSILYMSLLFWGLLMGPAAQACTTITTCEELQGIETTRDAGNCYLLGNDIDCGKTYFWNNNQGFVPITNFTGSIDGQGHTIKNLMINRGMDEEQKPVGLIQDTSGTVNISNLKLKGLYILGYNQIVGGLIGWASPGTTVSNVSVEGWFEGSTVGGLIGGCYGTSITGSSTDVRIGGFLAAGGLVGSLNNNSSISTSSSRGYVAANLYVGGLVGTNINSSISNSYSTAYVDSFGYKKDDEYTMDSYIGGLVGFIEKNDAAFTGRLISNSYAAGKIHENSDFQDTIQTGGLIGGMTATGNAVPVESYWDMETSGQTTSAGGAGVVGKTTAQMKTAATFAAFDFVNTWAPVCNGAAEYANYPRLKNEGIGCFDNLQTTKISTATLQENSFFGASVAADGTTMAVGMPGDNASGEKAGSVSIYVKDAGGNWVFSERVVSPDIMALDLFGKKVALSGDRLAVVQQSIAEGTTAAAVYLFRLMDGHWQYQAKIATSVDPSIALSGLRLVVGLPMGQDKRVDYYEESSGTWTKVSSLQNTRAGDPTAGKVQFGYSVALDGDWLVVGAPRASVFAPEKSQIVIYRWQGGAWVENNYFVHSGNRFGSALAISGNTIVAGASDFKTMGNIYVLEYNGTSWSVPEKLTYRASDINTIWGDGVAIQGDTLAVTGRRDPGIATSMVFKKVSGIWQEAYVLNPELGVTITAGSNLSTLAQSVAINGSSIILGEGLDSSLGTRGAGSVMVYGPDVTAPSAPASLAAAVQATSVGLSWAAATDNLGVAGYRIFRDGVSVGTSATTSYSDTGRTPGTTYSYQVKAVDGAGNVSAASTALSVTLFWKDFVGVTANSSNTLTKTAATGWGTGGAASVGVISGNGYVQFRGGAGASTKTVMCGLSASNANAKYTSIKYGLALTPTSVKIYENGTLRSTISGTYLATDQFRVERSGTTVRYKKNCTVLYTSTVASTGNLLVDAAIYNQGGTIENVTLSTSTTCP